MPGAPFEIRQVDLGEDALVVRIATRMRATLEEVLGEQRGGSMYSHDWLVDRVRQHLDPARLTGAVFAAERGSEYLGHTIVREERDSDGPFGLFSTTWVEPPARRTGVADGLLSRGEAWMTARGLPRAITYTSATNLPLVRLYLGRGYALGPAPPEWSILVRSLDGRAPPPATPGAR